eukprot:PhM_4_TR4845/c0_g1_i1/m.13833
MSNHINSKDVKRIPLSEYRVGMMHTWEPFLVVDLINTNDEWRSLAQSMSWENLQKETHPFAQLDVELQRYNQPHAPEAGVVCLDGGEELLFHTAVQSLKWNASVAPEMPHYVKLPLDSNLLPMHTLLGSGASNMVAADMPVLLCPGKYHQWVYVGETGSGSVNHIDVVGSTAWLVVLSGEKVWEVQHPLDPSRRWKFTQRAGEAVFVPALAEHRVINTSASISVTFNFIHITDAWQYEIKSMMNAAPSTRLAVICRDAKGGRRAVFTGCLPAGCVLPDSETLGDLALRQYMPQLQEACAGFRSLFNPAWTAAVGTENRVWRNLKGDHIVGLTFDFLSSKVWEKCFEGNEALTFVEACWEEAPGGVGPQPFPTVVSHCGRLTTCPPLSTFLGFSPFFSSYFKKLATPLSKVATPGKLCWHYARFPLEGTESKPTSWCGTYVFYTSQDPTGPTQLFPMTGDLTLRDAPPSDTPMEPSPHFRTLHLSAEPAGPTALQVIDLGSDLLRHLSLGFLMHDLAAIEPMLMLHGLHVPDYMTVGIDKVMTLILYFSDIPGLCGFHYSHTFSCVEEPNTLCFTADAASRLLTVQPQDVLEDAVLRLFVSYTDAAESDLPTGEDRELALLLIPREHRESIWAALLKARERYIREAAELVD